VRRHRIHALLACAAIPAVILVGCGGDDGGGDVDVGPAAAVPANTPIYLDLTVRPQGSARADAEAALGKILDTDDPGAKLISLINREGRQQKPAERFTYEADIEPWLGEQAAVFFTRLAEESEGAVVVETTNRDQALAAARKSESGATEGDYNGTTIYVNPTDHDAFALVGDFMAFGDEAGVKAAIDAQKGDSLGDSDDFKDAIGDLPDDRLGTFYTLPRDLLASIGPGEIDQSSQALLERSAGEALDQPVSGALTASADSIDLEFVGGQSGVETPESSLIGEVPGQSWLAVGFGDLGEIAKNTIDQLRDAGIPNFEAGLRQAEQTAGASIDQLTGALGDAALYVEGTTESTLTGALIMQTKDPDLTGRLLDQLQSLVQLGSSGTVRPLQLSGGTGFQIKDPGLAPQAVEIAQQNDKLVIGYGANSAARTLAPTDTLADSPGFSAARGQVSDLGTDFFLSFPAVFQLAESTGANSDPGYREAKPYIDALSYLVSGSGEEGDQTEVKAVLGLK
jgi:Protein of unknown function (DUF3352)